MLHYFHVSVLRNGDFLFVYVHAFATLNMLVLSEGML